MEKSKRYKGLDSLRGIFGVIICLGYHYFWIFPDGYGMEMPLSKLLYPFYKYGYFGVEFFFILSGFGIAGSYRDRILCREINFKKYILQRIKKLYPLMLITLAVVTIGNAVYKIICGQWFYISSFTFYDLLLSVFGISSGWLHDNVNFSIPIWYISVLILMYIIYFQVTWMSKNNKFIYISLCTVIFLLGWSFLVEPTEFPFMYERTCRGYFCFFGGCLLKELDELLQHKAKRIISGIGVFISGALLVLSGLYGAENVLGSIRVTLVLFIFPTLILATININLIDKILSFKPLVFLGEISTSLYFWHLPIFLIIRISALYVNITQYYSEVWFYFLIIIYSLIIAFLSNKYIEGKRFSEQIEKIEKRLLINTE